MFEEVKVLTHSSIRIAGEKVLYFDPYQVTEEYHDADVIFVTHDHGDHFSPEDIKKVKKADTIIVMPECMKGKEREAEIQDAKTMAPNSSLEIEGLWIQAIPSYNPAKQFHPRERNYVGYVVEMNGTTYFVAGDTDRTPENEQVVCDVALLPCGGKYTMDAEEAAGLANRIKPKLAIPTHYGTVVGQASDAERFEKLVDASIAVRRDI